MNDIDRIAEEATALANVVVTALRHAPRCAQMIVSVAQCDCGYYEAADAFTALMDGPLAALRSRLEDAEALARNVQDFCRNEAPAEWDGGDLGYSVGGLDAMATDLLALLAAAAVPEPAE